MSAALAAVVMLGACNVPGIGPAADGPTSTARSVSPSERASSVPSVGASVGAASVGQAGPSPTPIVDLQPVQPDRLVTTTLICERWGPEPPLSLVACGDAARLALAAVGSATAVRRLDVGYGEWCVATDSPCGERSPGVAWVLARTGESGPLRLRVARDAAGELAVWPAVPGPAVRPLAFDPPMRRAPPLGDAPPDLANRDPFPLCGEENLGASEAFAIDARRCFLTAVLAGSPAELDSRATSTEGEGVLTVYRFAGSGAIHRIVGSGQTWSASACGIARIDTPAIFEMAGGCLSVPP